MVETMASQYKFAADSPSRQLLHELGRLANATQQEFYARLDREAKQREVVHRNDLAAAAAGHERIRRNAEIARETLQLKLDAELRQREKEEQEELDRERAEREARNQRLAGLQEERERLQNIKAEQELVEKTKISRAAAEAAAAKREQEVAKQERDSEVAKLLREKEAATARSEKLQATLKASQGQEAATRSQNEECQRLRQEQQPKQPGQSQHQQAASTLDTPQLDASLVAEHARYLEIHKQLKNLRKFMVDQAAQDATLKRRMGDGRRAIRKCVGQLTGDAEARKAPVSISQSCL